MNRASQRRGASLSRENPDEWAAEIMKSEEATVKPVWKPFWGLFKGRKYPSLPGFLPVCPLLPPVCTSKGAGVCARSLLVPQFTSSYMCSPLMQNMLSFQYRFYHFKDEDFRSRHGYGATIQQLSRHLWQTVPCIKSISLFPCARTYLRPIFCPKSPGPVEW